MLNSSTRCIALGAMLLLGACNATSTTGGKMANVTLGEMAAGVQKDNKEATHWLRQAAEKGVPEAQVNYAAALRLGRGVEKDEAEGARWLRKAADSGFAPAQNDLGAMYLHGTGVTKDPAEAMRWFHKAAE